MHLRTRFPSILWIAAIAAIAAATGGVGFPSGAAERRTVGEVMGENKATPVSRLKVAQGFEVELLYSVPAPQGSWVALCVDPKGRIIASDQYGGLYRFSPPAAGQPLDPARVEKIPVEIRAANGLLWAFDAL